MKTILCTLLLFFSLGLSACQPIQAPTDTEGAEAGTAPAEATAAPTPADAEIHLTILHLNDVYEITPVSGGKYGGLARITTLKKELLVANPNTILTFSGDLYGPSGLSNAAIVDGKPLSGKPVVAAMNTVGVDYATFGDHEFDQFSADEVAARMAETQYPVISSNTFDAKGNPFPGVTRNTIFTVTNSLGDAMRVGLFAVTEPIGSSKLPFTQTGRITATAEQVAELEGQTDLLIALTHFEVKQDVDTAQRFPQIDLILGGDDHEHMKVEAGPDLAPIFKSDSNARNVQIIDLYYNKSTGALRIEDRLQPVTDAIADDPTTKATTDQWLQIGFDALRAQGIVPERVVVTPTVDLDGFATSIRNQPTELTKVILDGINQTVPNAELSILTSGFIRLDDLIPTGGAFTEYDVVRTFPNDLAIVSFDIPGAALAGTLDFGAKSAGSGSYLLMTDNVSRGADGQWLLNGQPLDPKHIYRVGASKGESFLTKFGAKVVQTHTVTLRQALITQLTTTFGTAVK
jgi:5'-nucleotidase